MSTRSRGGRRAGGGLFPLPGFAVTLPSPTATRTSGTPTSPATPGATPSTIASGTPAPAPTGSPAPSPTGAPGTPSLAITPTVWPLAVSSISGRCTSVPAETGNTTVSQTITNNGSGIITWQWQSAVPALPGDFQYQLNGGLWSLEGTLPGNLLLSPGQTDTLNVRLACGTSYSVTVVAHATLGSAASTYGITLRMPGLP